jgi:hypothetical protein
MTTDKTCGPAFPRADDVSNSNSGMTLREYAAIKLLVPDSGTDWLDAMIRRAKRDAFADRAPDPHEEELNCWKRKFAHSHNGQWPSDIVAKSALSYQYADAMIAARTGGADQ